MQEVKIILSFSFEFLKKITASEAVLFACC